MAAICYYSSNKLDCLLIFTTHHYCYSSIAYKLGTILTHKVPVGDTG